MFETKDNSVPPAFDPAKVYGKPRDEERRLQKVDCQDTHSRKHAIGPGISKKNCACQIRPVNEKVRYGIGLWIWKLYNVAF